MTPFKPQACDRNGEMCENEGLRCPPEYAGPYFVYDFMPQKIMFKSDGNDTTALDVLSVRGWGHLTGQGEAGLKINPEAAVAIQDNFGKWVASVLNKEIKTLMLEELSK